MVSGTRSVPRNMVGKVTVGASRDAPERVV